MIKKRKHWTSRSIEGAKRIPIWNRNLQTEITVSLCAPCVVFLGADGEGKGCKIIWKVLPGKKIRDHNFCLENNLILIGYKFFMEGKFCQGCKQEYHGGGGLPRLLTTLLG